MTRAIELEPYNVKYYCKRADLSKPDAAIEDYTKALELAPDSENIYLCRGDAYAKFEKFSEALADFNKAIALDENYTNVYKRRGELYLELENYDAAIDDFVKVIETSKANFYKVECGRLWRLCNKLGKYNTELPKNHTSAMVYFARGFTSSWREKNLDKVREDLTKAIECDPNCALLYFQRAKFTVDNTAALNDYQPRRKNHNFSF